MNGGRAAQEENDMDARNAEGPGETFVRSTGSPHLRASPVTRKRLEGHVTGLLYSVYTGRWQITTLDLFFGCGGRPAP